MQRHKWALLALKITRTIVYFATWWLAMHFVAESVAQLQRMFPDDHLMNLGVILLLCVSVDAFATSNERTTWKRAIEGMVVTGDDDNPLMQKFKQLEDDPML